MTGRLFDGDSDEDVDGDPKNIIDTRGMTVEQKKRLINASENWKRISGDLKMRAMILAQELEDLQNEQEEKSKALDKALDLEYTEDDEFLQKLH